MTFTQLLCFIEVAQQRNFTKAANALHIVQSGISYNIAELEKELNVKLFIRDQKNVTLTYAGEQLLEKSLSIFSLTKDMEIIARKIAKGANGKLRIGYPFVPIIYQYRDIFSSFQEHNPSIDMKYGSYPANELADQLIKKQLDIIFTRYAMIPHHQKIEWRPLYKDKLCVVVGQKHPLHHKKTASIKEFEQDILILCGRHYDPGWYDLVLEACLREQCTPEIHDRCSDVYSVLLTVELGTGFTILPHCWKANLNNNLSFIEIENSLQPETGIAWNQEITNESVRLFLKEFSISVPNTPAHK